MVRNVGNAFPVYFKAEAQQSNISEENKFTSESVTELGTTTPDFAVKIPQKYTKIDEVTLKNGLKIHSYKLANGHKITIVPMPGSPAIVKNYVNVGSMNETDDIKGISHFLEHMAFNGTIGDNGYKKLEWGDPFKLVDKLGGWINASTNYAITDYVNSTPILEDKDIEEQIKIIAAMTENLSLPENMIEKEKSPVCSEINMILDAPSTIVFDQTVRTLFNIRSSADELVAGSTKHIQNLDRETVKAYYDKYYTPDNMNLVITGDVNPDEVIEIVAKEFRSTKKTTGNKYEEKLIPINKTVRKDFISDKATSAEIAIGFAGPANNDAKSDIIMDILSEYLASEELGLDKALKELNTSGVLSGDKVSTNPYNPTLCIFYANCVDNKSEEVLKVLFDKFSALHAPSEKLLKQIKDRLLMHYNDSLEYSSAVNGIIGRTNLSGNSDYLEKYEETLESITSADVEEAIQKYLNINKAAISVVHPKTDIETLNTNYNNANNLTFKGTHRKPVNTDKVYETTLDNNFKIAFQETENSNISFDVELKYDIPDDINPAAFTVLSKIYSTGTGNKTEDDYNMYLEENNLSQNIYCNNRRLVFSGYSSSDNFEMNLNEGIELLYNPRINEEELKKAVDKIKENILRTPYTADGLFTDYESKYVKRYIARDDMLNYLEKITVEDVVKAHDYILNNSCGRIAMNIPSEQSELKAKAVDLFSQIKKANPYKTELREAYRETSSPVVLTKDRNVSQADITQIYKFKVSNNIKDEAVTEIMNTILSSSDSIGLFNSLRERDHLAYSVFSNYDKNGDCGTISLNILTTTDNKDTGEISYDNVQKSINGFNRQIGLLLNSKYTDEDLESAKRILKADLLKTEGVRAKIYALSLGLDKPEGVEYSNKLFNVIDSITREDVDKMAANIFSKQPIYAIVASKDTLDANKDFFEQLKN